jgi:hypothetical protein
MIAMAKRSLAKSGYWRFFSRIDELDILFYLISNPDIHKSGINPYLHWVNYGKREFRFPNTQFSKVQILDETSIRYKQISQFLALNFKSVKIDELVVSIFTIPWRPGIWSFPTKFIKFEVSNKNKLISINRIFVRDAMVYQINSKMIGFMLDEE